MKLKNVRHVVYTQQYNIQNFGVAFLLFFYLFTWICVKQKIENQLRIKKKTTDKNKIKEKLVNFMEVEVFLYLIAIIIF